VQFADISGGSQQAVTGALIALESRHHTGRGQFVDVSMMHGSMKLLPVVQSTFHSGARVPPRGAGLLSGGFACYNVYRTSDGRWLTVGALEPKFWKTLCGELGCTELIDDQFAPAPRQAELKARLASIFSTDTAHGWFARLGNKDCCVAPVRTIDEVQADVRITPDLGGTPGAYTSEAPALGEHTGAILKEFGYSDQQIAQFHQTGVTG
jgi:crotonobetainyl-CoA:carnitine CoA-transferase CaiB-like acyl-CoA transferase